MFYSHNHTDVLLSIVYGSRLYGTSTPVSDVDFKSITLPDYETLILGQPLKTERYRFDSEGHQVSTNITSPEGGYESEHTPVHKFVQDYLGGQAYAVEFVHAVLGGAHEHNMGAAGTESYRRSHRFLEFCRTLACKFPHKNLAGMTGFAMKQTFDYVHRGRRLIAARAIRTAVQDILNAVGAVVAPVYSSQPQPVMRLNSMFGAEQIIDVLAAKVNLEIGSTETNNTVLRTLKLNGRQYTETTTIRDFLNAVEKLIDQYGERSTAAAEVDVDWKSLSHAVRVYEQVIELAETGFITFPRPNADYLLSIKEGAIPVEQVKDLLIYLEEASTAALEASSLPEVTPALRKEASLVLFDFLEREYHGR